MTIDILVYAHDGRGIGHAGRSVAICLGLRRLYPDLKVLLVTGNKNVAGLAAGLPLDWIKLPSYETEVVDGVSRGARGTSNIGDKELGILRGQLIADIVTRLNPRLVLCDHTPQGKHSELLPAQELSANSETLWVLGVRGVIGRVGKVWSEHAATCFKKRFCSILWYGDVNVVGEGELDLLHDHYGVYPVSTGYVSRLRELLQWGILPPSQDSIAVTAGVSWSSGTAVSLVKTIAGAAREMGPRVGRWRIYIDIKGTANERNILTRAFDDIDHCDLLPFGPQYLSDLIATKAGLVFGGYNSLTDLIAVEKPGVVLVRGMKDDEQKIHAEALSRKAGGLVALSEDSISPQRLADGLYDCILGGKLSEEPIALDGVERAAHALVNIMRGDS